VYSSYPNGLPVYNIDETTAEKVIHAVNPSLAINKRQYVYGRIIHENQMVGAVLYPIHEQDAIELEGMLRDPLMTQDQKDERINQNLPKLAAKDPGPFHIYDLSTKQLVLNPKGLPPSKGKKTPAPAGESAANNVLSAAAVPLPRPLSTSLVPAPASVVSSPMLTKPSSVVSSPMLTKPSSVEVLKQQPPLKQAIAPVITPASTSVLPAPLPQPALNPVAIRPPLPQNYYEQVTAPPYPF
jgi:hypothetical protein